MVAVEREVGEVVFGRLDFLGVFIRGVAQRDDIGMAIERIGYRTTLRVEAFAIRLALERERMISSISMSLATNAV